jgi:hypothetical protein
VPSARPPQPPLTRTGHALNNRKALHHKLWVEFQIWFRYNFAMSSVSTIQLSHLRNIGWELWDPIGLRDVRDSGCEDEYDTYLLQVVSRLTRRDTRSEVASYLVNVESENMGLGFTISALARATATVEAIEAYLRRFQRGTFSVRSHVPRCR